MKQKINRASSLLQEATSQYVSILELMNSITRADINISVEKLTSVSKEIVQKQKTATIIDNQLLPLLSTLPNEVIDNKQLQKRTDLLQSIIQVNEKIVSRFNNIKSLISSELEQIKNSRCAIKGYGKTEYTHGKNLNNTL